MRRRDFITAGAATVAYLRSQQGLASSKRTINDIEGCLLMPGDPQLLGLESQDFGALPADDQLIDTTGDPELDRALGKALARTARMFGVTPGFAFYRDDNGPNAFASPETRVAGTWGSVIFGRRLFTDQFRRYRDQDQGMSVVAIVAHEFGHIMQYRRHLTDDLRAGERTVRRVELHADFMSGWYLGKRKREDPGISLWASGDTFHRIGDYQFNNVSHHGTPEQRVAAAEAGFQVGFNSSADSGQAVDEGQRYIRAKISGP